MKKEKYLSKRSMNTIKLERMINLFISVVSLL